MIYFGQCTRLLFVFFLITFGADSMTNQKEELFLRANKYAEEQDWNAAIALYEKIEPKGVGLLYNMGVCYNAVGDYARALGVWLRAQKMASYEQKKQLESVILLTKAQIDGKPISWFDWAHRQVTLLFGFMTLFGMQLLFLFMWFFYLLFSIRARKNGGRDKKWLQKSVQGGLLFMLSFLSVGIFIRYDEMMSMQAVIVASQSNLYAGPAEMYQTIGALEAGNIVTIVESRADWCKVYTKDGMGWVLADEIYQV